MSVKNEVNTNEQLNKTIISTALKTLAVLLAGVILVFSMFLLLAPLAAGNFFYGIGFKKWSAGMTYSAAKNSDDFDIWYSSLVRGVGVDNYEITYNSAKKLEAFEDYNELIAKKDIKITNLSDGKNFSAKHYVAYNKIRAGVLLYKNTELNAFWNTVVDWTVKNRFEPELNPLKGYIDALAKDTGIAVGEADFLGQMDDLRSRKGVFLDGGMSWLNTEQVKDLAVYVVKLIDARGWSESARTDWLGRA